MTRSHYHMIVAGVKAMMDQVIAPHQGQPVTTRLAAMMADDLNEFMASLREVAVSLTSTNLPSIDDDWLDDWSDEMDGDWPDDEVDDQGMLAFGSEQTDTPAEEDHRAEYLQFVADRKRKS